VSGGGGGFYDLLETEHFLFGMLGHMDQKEVFTILPVITERSLLISLATLEVPIQEMKQQVKLSFPLSFFYYDPKKRECRYHSDTQIPLFALQKDGSKKALEGDIYRFSEGEALYLEATFAEDKDAYLQVSSE
jgi:hypothetical protein